MREIVPRRQVGRKCVFPYNICEIIDFLNNAERQACLCVGLPLNVVLFSFVFVFPYKFLESLNTHGNPFPPRSY